MIDKLWYDWQRAHKDNFWAFEGGTVRDLDTWPKYTNGGPPAMTVGSYVSVPFCSIIDYKGAHSA